jgi:cytosine/adenosine deaminase-related metal-dependent hydrolase
MYTRTFLEVFGTEPEDCSSVMASVRQLQEKAVAAGLSAAPTPHACYTMSPELLTASSMAGLASGFLSYHSEESSEEEEMVRFGRGPMWDNRKKAGMSTPPVIGKSSLLYFIDMLLAGTSAPIDGHILLVHEVCLDEEGIDAVRSTMLHPYFALCPLSNIFIHNALPPVPLMRRNGLKLCIGTDSLSSNDDLDMLKEIFCLQENFPEVPLGELFTWASTNGADFLSLGSLGSFFEGKKPGAVFVDHLDREGRLTSASRSRRMI